MLYRRECLDAALEDQAQRADNSKVCGVSNAVRTFPCSSVLAGSEFCSDAHRREYQQEYSDLALGRLLQSKPPGPENSAGLNGATPLLTPPPAANGHSAPPLPCDHAAHAEGGAGGGEIEDRVRPVIKRRQENGGADGHSVALRAGAGEEGATRSGGCQSRDDR